MWWVTSRLLQLNLSPHLPSQSFFIYGGHLHAEMPPPYSRRRRCPFLISCSASSSLSVWMRCRWSCSSSVFRSIWSALTNPSPVWMSPSLRKAPMRRQWSLRWERAISDELQQRKGNRNPFQNSREINFSTWF